ncbi:D-amino acid dehydrogenase [Inhella gelatinilytica]|uniref:D-amino acid dehydrogenase n=1 Tax=Inhella gelatinilytica TaxID=2795030 RepID=A0A931NDF1_9BURK|nr:D-amino acid dehydrogenase [Inhella gelatinilytica]MBH9552170.1 D-amino acid dehydrogenase [Inhella gelatinilytica]
MKVIVLGAGILGVCSAWYLREAGHDVVLVDRQPGAGLETSYANGAQISVSFCEPWANAWVPIKVAKWLLRDDSPLLFRPRLEWAQMRYGLAFLTQCNTASFERNVEELVQLGRYSHARLKELVAATGIEYNRLEKGILHFFSSQQDLDAGAAGAEVMRRHGVDRRVLSREDVLRVEPALTTFGHRIFGGTYTPSDESGDALVFTQKLAQLAAERGVEMRFSTTILSLDKQGQQIGGVRVRGAEGQVETLKADAYVVALASYAPALVNPVADCLNIYPTKGYSATLRLKRPEAASTVSLLDDTRKIAISRLGDYIRIAGTAEMAGLDLNLDSPTARTRCAALVNRYEELFPGVAELSEPNFWTGLRPSTPTNIPYLGRSRKLSNLWLNCGHGTLGWTHGAGSGHALAELISGRQPETSFTFYAT